MKNEMPSLLLDEKTCFIRLPTDKLQNFWQVITFFFTIAATGIKVSKRNQMNYLLVSVEDALLEASRIEENNTKDFKSFWDSFIKLVMIFIDILGKKCQICNNRSSNLAGYSRVVHNTSTCCCFLF